MLFPVGLLLMAVLLLRMLLLLQQTGWLTASVRLHSIGALAASSL